MSRAIVLALLLCAFLAGCDSPSAPPPAAQQLPPIQNPTPNTPPLVASPTLQTQSVEQASRRFVIIANESTRLMASIMDMATLDAAITNIRKHDAEFDQIAETLHSHGITFTLRGIPDDAYAAIEAAGNQHDQENKRIAQLPDGPALFTKLANELSNGGPYGVGRVKWRLVNKSGLFSGIAAVFLVSEYFAFSPRCPVAYSSRYTYSNGCADLQG